MGYIKKEKDGAFDLEKLPEGVYFFSGEEGFVKVEVDKHGHQSWDLKNWFSSLDPDKNETKRLQIIQNIKTRINAATGLINPPEKKNKKGLMNFFKNL